jgi:hypothetical protein
VSANQLRDESGDGGRGTRAQQGKAGIDTDDAFKGNDEPAGGLQVHLLPGGERSLLELHVGDERTDRANSRQVRRRRRRGGTARSRLRASLGLVWLVAAGPALGFAGFTTRTVCVYRAAVAPIFVELRMDDVGDDGDEEHPRQRTTTEKPARNLGTHLWPLPRNLQSL